MKTTFIQVVNQLHLILSSVEDTLDEENTQKIPAAYFASFLALLEQYFSEDSIGNDDLSAKSTVYLLDVVAPYVSPALLRLKFVPILQKLAGVLTRPESDPALLRSSIGVLETILLAQDSSAWSLPTSELSSRRGMMGLINIALDPRPKVRKRAQEAITAILAHPPASPKLEHPASLQCAEASLQAVDNYIKEVRKKGKGEKDSQPRLIHALQLVRAISSADGWPSEKFEALCHTLFTVAKTTDHYLVVASFNVFESIFKSIDQNMGSDRWVKIINTIVDLIPSYNDQHLSPAWLAVVAQAASSYATIQPNACFKRLPSMFKVIIGFLESDNKNIQISACQCLVSLISTCIPETLLLLPGKDKESKQNYELSNKTLQELSGIVFGLLHIKYQSSWQEVTQILIALFDQLRWRSDPHLINCLKVVGALRSEVSFADGREDSDKVIAAAIRNLGPEIVLKHIPLVLKPTMGIPGTAWLLPLLRDNIQYAKLGQYVNEILPISEKLVAMITELKQVGDKGQSAVHAKIYDTINDQIWSLLPKYCNLPFDLKESFTQSFAELLANALYKTVELRPVICQALRLLVESNVAFADGIADEDVLLQQRFSKSEAKENIDYVSKSFAPKILSVLFNVFSQTLPEYRNYILECITAYLTITSAPDIEVTFNRIATLLHNALQEEDKEKKEQEVKKQGMQKGTLPAMSLTMMDLVVAITPFLPKSCHNSLLSIFVTAVKSSSTQLQKKGFRVLTRLTEREDGETTVKENLANLQATFEETSDLITAPSRGARLSALSKIIEYLPNDELHFIPGILPETVLATKDVNEKTREAAYDLLVQIGYKMKLGGVIHNSKVAAMGDPEAPDVPACLEEYFTMLSAGLAGSTPNMISATVTGLSRILFEFKQEISTELLNELSSTVELFLTSKNKEIVKATLGFVKITITTLPDDIVRPTLKTLIPKLMVWSHEHSSHFKAKVKHIIERLIRRFGMETVSENFPEEDMKLLTNIRKAKERAKRKSSSKEAVDSKEKNKPRQQYSNEFDRAVYGSNSEDEESEDDQEQHKWGGSKGKNQKKYILESRDEPLDLLDQKSFAHITSSKPRTQRKLGIRESSKFAKDRTGKIVVKDVDQKEDENSLQGRNAIDAYVEAVKQGPTRGQRNKLKYKRSRKDAESDDDDSEDEVASKKPKGGKENRKFSKPRPKKIQRRGL